MRRLVALLGLGWAAANVVIAYFFVTGAFLAKTAAKEGPLAQLSLLAGGVLITVFAVMLGWECVRMVGGPAAARGK